MLVESSIGFENIVKKREIWEFRTCTVAQHLNLKKSAIWVLKAVSCCCMSGYQLACAYIFQQSVNNKHF
jgi:hypothetical protein